jgi:hypothetical protein
MLETMLKVVESSWNVCGSQEASQPPRGVSDSMQIQQHNESQEEFKEQISSANMS